MRGGKQPGAGRPKGTLNPDTLRKQLIRKRILARFEAEVEAMVDAQIASAKGINHFFMRNSAGQFEQVKDPKLIAAALNAGEEGSYYWIFTQNPNTQAFAAIADRSIDKPSEHVEMTGAEGGPLVVKWASAPIKEG